MPAVCSIITRPQCDVEAQQQACTQQLKTCGSNEPSIQLLANQQEDVDGLIQNIVTNLCGSRKGLTNWLRDFIKIDNHRALEVGHLNGGLGTFTSGRPKGSEGYPQVTVRESPDELMLRAEEVGTWKSCINVDRIAKERWGLLLVDADCLAFCQAFLELNDAQKEMSRAVGVKKPQEAQKAKALWKMKAAKDAGEETTIQRVKTTSWEKQYKISTLEEHLKDPIVALDKTLKCVENSCWKVLARVLCGGSVLQ